MGTLLGQSRLQRVIRKPRASRGKQLAAAAEKQDASLCRQRGSRQRAGRPHPGQRRRFQPKTAEASSETEGPARGDRWASLRPRRPLVNLDAFAGKWDRLDGFTMAKDLRFSASTLLDSATKEVLRKTIRGLREKLVAELSQAAKSEYHLDVSLDKAQLPEARRCRRERLEAWLDEQIRGATAEPQARGAAAKKGKASKAASAGKGKASNAGTKGKKGTKGRARQSVGELRARFLGQAVTEAAHTLVNRLAFLRILEHHGVLRPALITGGSKSAAYEQEFVHYAGPLASSTLSGDDTRGYRELLEVVFAEYALELPGLFGPVGLTPLFPIPARTLGFVARRMGFRARRTGFRARRTGFRARRTGFRTRRTGFRTRRTGFRARRIGCGARRTRFLTTRIGCGARRATIPPTRMRFPRRGSASVRAGSALERPGPGPRRPGLSPPRRERAPGRPGRHFPRPGRDPGRLGSALSGIGFREGTAT